MSYELELWDYENEDDIQMVIDHFKKNRRLVILIDRDQTPYKSFIIVGDRENEELDILQGQIIQRVVNEKYFPN